LCWPKDKIFNDQEYELREKTSSEEEDNRKKNTPNIYDSTFAFIIY